MMSMEMLSQKNEEDVQKLYSENGVELTIEDVREIGRVLNSLDNEELDAEDLDNVAGGIAISGAICWGIAKAIFAIGTAGIAVYRWYKSR